MGVAKFIHPKDRAEILRLRDAGLSNVEIAKLTGRSSGTVGKVVRERCMDMPYRDLYSKRRATVKPGPPAGFVPYNFTDEALAYNSSPIILVGFRDVPEWARKFGDRVELRPFAQVQP